MSNNSRSGEFSESISVKFCLFLYETCPNTFWYNSWIWIYLINYSIEICRIIIEEQNEILAIPLVTRNTLIWVTSSRWIIIGLTESIGVTQLNIHAITKWQFTSCAFVKEKSWIIFHCDDRVTCWECSLFEYKWI